MAHQRHLDFTEGKIILEYGDIFASPAQALVNPVNCFGVSGAGLAKAFRERFPVNEELYRKACLRKALRIGRVFPVRLTGQTQPEYIINFPTKDHWKQPSRPDWIRRGLFSLSEQITILGLRSLALPALGCGLGGLDFPEVQELVLDYLGDFPDQGTAIHLYAPR